MKRLPFLTTALLVLLLVNQGLCWGAGNALIVLDGMAGIEATVATNLASHLTNAGYTVSTSVGVPGGSLSAYGQVWDIRFNNTTPVADTDIRAYTNFMAGGGSLFVMGENSGFAVRNNSISNLISRAGGGPITFSTPNNSQTVRRPFNGPTAITSITFLAAGGMSDPGTGSFITRDTIDRSAAIAFCPGSLASAPAGTLIVVFDVNFLDLGADANSHKLTDNIIFYMAAPFAFPADAGNALIVVDGTLGMETTVATNLANHLTNAGYMVSANVGVPGGSLSGYGQVWDVRFNNSTPVADTDIAAYTNFMAGGGSLFVMGENSGFAVRNNSISNLISSAGGGPITFATPTDSQAVRSPFKGPNAITNVTFLGAGGMSDPGTGSFITRDTSNRGTAIAFGPGSLARATPGTLIVVFDINFLDIFGSADSQKLTANMIAYLAEPFGLKRALPFLTLLLN